ncbi:MAG: hypothetical protein WD342_19825 [Verrucomicrobiales bacterium]
MRIPTIILCCGLFMVAAISLVIRDVFFVRALSLLAIVVLAMLGIAFTRRVVSRQAARSTLLVGTLVLAGLAFTNAPLRLIFAAYESRFEAVSDKLLEGERPNFPLWIGPFRAIDGGVRDGSGAPYLMTSGHPYEINGFVRDPKGTYFNLWSITPVSDGWAYIEED